MSSTSDRLDVAEIVKELGLNLISTCELRKLVMIEQGPSPREVSFDGVWGGPQKYSQTSLPLD